MSTIDNKSSDPLQHPLSQWHHQLCQGKFQTQQKELVAVYRVFMMTITI
jgi:hypothetical protein